MEKKYNTKSPAVKRLMREAAEMASATADYFATPLEDNLFEWHFTVRGPESTDFEGGVYHGRIIVPPDYPMKPPDIIVLTPNGRFTVGKKICLSISGFHPETWQPSWSIRTALLAIIGFMPTPGHGTIGSLDYTPEERKVLAQRSVSFACEECGVTSLLLAPPSGETPSPARDQQLRHILHSMSLKSEEEILEEKNRLEASPNIDSQQPTGQLSAAPAVEPAAAAPAVVSAAAAGSTSTAIGSSGSQNRSSSSSPRRVAGGAGDSRAFQLYDFLIMLVVASIGILIFRRIAITELLEGEPGEEHLQNDDI